MYVCTGRVISIQLHKFCCAVWRFHENREIICLSKVKVIMQIVTPDSLFCHVIGFLIFPPT